MGNLVTGAEAFEAWRGDVLHGASPERWACGPPEIAQAVDLGPGQIVLLGAPPGTGKTALVLQWTFDALAMNADLRGLVANVEMSVPALLDRLLARVSGVPLDVIAGRALDCRQAVVRERVADSLDKVRPLVERAAFLEPPFSIAEVAGAMDKTGARLCTLDYLQRIRPEGEHDSQREAIESLMTGLRSLAQAGAGVLAVSAVGRQRNHGGSGYAGLNLASYRGSSELEFAVDSAFLLEAGGDGPELAALRCVKRRNGRPTDVMLRFEGEFQRFTPVAFPDGAEGGRHG